MGLTRTPDEIKKGLGCCNEWCNIESCPYWEDSDCTNNVRNDAIALIQQLEADLEDMTARYKIADDCAKKKGEMNEKLYAELTAAKAERDAAVRDLTEMAQDTDESCEYCEMFKTPHCSLECRMKNKGFKWRGVQKEE